MELIFLTYINRSGSTYLAQTLSSSEEILVCPEAEILVEKFLEDPEKEYTRSGKSRETLIRELRADNKFRHWDISQEELESISRGSNNYWNFCSILNLYREKNKPGATKIVFKAERIIYLWNKIIKACDSDDLLHLISIHRDPRGVYASQKNTKWPGTDRSFSQNPVHTGILLNHYFRQLQRLMLTNPEIILIRFEDLLNYPEESIKKLSSNINLKKTDFSPLEGDFYSRIPDDQKSIHKNISSPPIREKENEWKVILNNLEVDLIQSLTKNWMNKFGYIAESRKIGFLKIWSIILPETISFYFRLYTEKIIFRINRIINGQDSH